MTTHPKGEAAFPEQERTAREASPRGDVGGTVDALRAMFANLGDERDDHYNPASAGMAGPEVSVPRAHTSACVLSPDHYGFCFDDVAE